MPAAPGSKNGPRSTFSFLPFELQYRIIGMIQDGMTCRAIAAVPEVKRAYDGLGSAFNGAAMTRIRKSKQYREWAEQRLREKNMLLADRLTSAILRENATIDTIAEQTKVELLEVVRKCVGAAADPREVERLVRSAATISNTAKDREIATLKRKLDDAKRNAEEQKQAAAAREAELLARIEDMKQQVAAITTGARQGGLSPDALAEIERKIGLM